MITIVFIIAMTAFLGVLFIALIIDQEIKKLK